MSERALVWSVFLWILVATALAGVLARRRRASAVLPLYLAAMVLNVPPMWFWPDRFYTWGYWLGTEVLEALLRLALVVELLLLVFGRLPVGRRRAAGIGLVVLLLTALAIALAPPAPTGSAEAVYAAAAQRAAEATFAAGFLCVALLFMATHYRVPLDPLHRDVVVGLALWASLQAFPVDFAVLDPWLHLGRQGLQRIMAAGVMLAWVRAAWRVDAPSPLPPDVLRVLQPWRAT